MQPDDDSLIASIDPLMAAIRSAVLQMQGNIVGFNDDGLLVVELADGETMAVNYERMKALVANGTENIDSVVARFFTTSDYFSAQMSDPRSQRAGLRLVLESSEMEAPDELIHRPLSDQLSVMLEWTDPEETGMVLLTEDIISDWSVSLNEAWRIAAENMNLVLEQAKVETLDVGDGRILAYLSTDSALKASLILAPSLRARVEPHIGWPVLAVVPCRDFLYLIPDNERGNDTIPALGKTVVEEYSQSPYSLSTEVFRISDEGVVALGAFDPNSK